MTREEALHRVKGYLTDIIPAEDYQEVEEIVKALEPESCEDCISRKAVLDHIYGINGLEGLELSNVFEKHYADFIKSLPPVTPQVKLEQSKRIPISEELTNKEEAQKRLTNKGWIDFLSEQFDVSRTSARDMLHTMMSIKKEDNFKKEFNKSAKPEKIEEDMQEEEER